MTDEKKITYACGICMHEGTEVCASCCPYQGGIPDRWEPKESYLCDPDKNTACKKRACYINGGECSRTFNRDFARDNPLEETKTQWISGKKRPELYREVLAYIERDSWGNGKNRPTKKREIAIAYYGGGNWHAGTRSGVRCLYWMPLPAPPKEA